MGIDNAKDIKTVDLVYTKYMKALIDYEGIQRVEQFMFHKDAFREILLNAIVHKDYSSCNPIQISVYEDKIYIWNDGEMPPNLDSTDKLFMKHSSKPYNPKLANVFFKSGMIEAWGRDKYLDLLATKEKVDSIISDERIMSEKMSELKKEPIIKIMSYLKDNEEITTTKGMEITGKSAAQVRRYLKALSGLGIIKSTRNTKGNVYVKV